ncbi:hypothetical protein BPOR_0036g00020 [Botrytis porri]|uniref:Uncharacterized protein n=1 Tax=Botrytis porri TaxID=87229 RepID=A0A4Z1L2W1_9HELO|nr:hypothetical protein BPOR_0036g00020 [Botrytis porri]
MKDPSYFKLLSQLFVILENQYNLDEVYLPTYLPTYLPFSNLHSSLFTFFSLLCSLLSYYLGPYLFVIHYTQESLPLLSPTLPQPYTPPT